MKYTKIILCVLAILPWSVTPSVAQERGSRHEPSAHEHGRPHERDVRHGPRWHGEIGRFHDHDLGLWRDGRWTHGRHDGRLGWWWVVAGLWYFYPSPVYPYPDPYQPPVVSLPATPPTPQYWYYCAAPVGYYPYVAQCRVNWQQVPASPPPTSGPQPAYPR